MSLSIMIDSPARRVKTSIAYPSFSRLDVLSRDLHLTPDMPGCSVKPMYVLVRPELQINASTPSRAAGHMRFCDDRLVFLQLSNGSLMAQGPYDEEIRFESPRAAALHRNVATRRTTAPDSRSARLFFTAPQV